MSLPEVNIQTKFLKNFIRHQHSILKASKTEHTDEEEEKKEVPKPKKVSGAKMFQALMRFNMDDDI